MCDTSANISYYGETMNHVALAGSERHITSLIRECRLMQSSAISNRCEIRKIQDGLQAKNSKIFSTLHW